MKTRYLLKKRGSVKGVTHPIFVALYEGDVTELIFTGQRIPLKEWSTSDRLPKDQKGEIYKEITRVMDAIGKAKVRLDAAEQPVTPYTVKTEYDQWRKERDAGQLSK